jgi:hypothetical protein
VRPSATEREELAENLSTHFRPAATGSWEVRAEQEMQVDAPAPSMQETCVVCRGEDEPYSSHSQTEAAAVADVLNVLEIELRPKKNPT